MSDDVIVNAADEAATRGQVRAVLSRILAKTTQKPGPGL
jgi:hypothetical protein